MNVHCGGWFKKFCEGDDSLDNEGQSSWPLEFDNNQLREITEVDPLQSHKKLPQNSMLTNGHSAFEANWKVKKLDKWISHELSKYQKKKKLLFWSVMFSYSMQQQNISQWDCDMQQKVDFIRQPETTSSVVGLKRSSKALPKAKFEPKKGHGHCLVVRCQSDPLQLSEFQRNDHIWEVCSANQRDALKIATLAANTGHQRGSSSLPRQRATACDTTNQRIRLRGSASSTVLTWPLAHRLPLQASQQLFAGKMLPQAAEAENGFQEVAEFHSMDFFLLGLNTYSFLAKNVLIVMVPTLINRDEFEPSYNDLKFRVQNHCYFCTNLIVKAKRI